MIIQFFRSFSDKFYTSFHRVCMAREHPGFWLQLWESSSIKERKNLSELILCNVAGEVTLPSMRILMFWVIWCAKFELGNTKSRKDLPLSVTYCIAFHIYLNPNSLICSLSYLIAYSNGFSGWAKEGMIKQNNVLIVLNICIASSIINDSYKYETIHICLPDK